MDEGTPIRGGVSKAGVCCDPCAAGYNPCSCGEPTVAWFCRTRGGRADLCGFNPWVPVNPPKLYRAYQISGSVRDLGTRYEFAGRCAYPSGGCVPAGSGQSKATNLSTNATITQELGCMGVGNITGTVTNTPDEKRYADAYGGVVVRRLSEPDSLGAAIKRMKPPPVWSGWSSGGCCAMSHQTNTSIIFAEAQAKFVAQGQVNGRVTVEVVLEQTPIGGGGSSRFSFQVTVYCDGSGSGEEVIDLPMVPEMTTCIKEVNVLS